MTSSPSTVRPPRDESERAALEQILVESFGADELPWGTWMERIGHENLRVVVEGDTVRGGLGFYRFGQWWGGERLPLIGLAGVGVTPVARGRGLARRFLVDTLRDARAEGVPLAALYATSVAVYRSVGFEQAGSALRFSAPLEGFPAGDLTLPCEAFSPRERDPRLEALYAHRARRWNGHLDRSDAIRARIAQPYKGVARGYRFGPADAPEGYVVYTHAAGEDLHFSVVLRDLVLTTPRATSRCLALLSGLRSLAREVRWLGPLSDPLLSHLPEQTAKITESSRWMLRILDVPGALRMRGYVADGDARFGVTDPLFGDVGVRLSVRGGHGTVDLEPFERASTRLDVRGLAALFTGFTHATTLHAMGLAVGDLDETLALARLLAGPEPWLCDWF